MTVLSHLALLASCLHTAMQASNVSCSVSAVDVCTCAEAKLAGLMEEFGEFDEGLVRTLLEDQAGDVLEVRVYLGVSPA